MFRKIASIFVLILFVVSTNGFTISKHYCRGELVSVALSTDSASCCDMGSCGCCHEESEFLQLKNDFTTSQHSKINQSVSFELMSIKLDNIQSIEITKKSHLTNDVKEPPFNDRKFLYYIHQFKLAPPIC